MFCEECGTKNEQEAVFCEKCGHKLNKSEKKAVVQKEKKPMSKKTKTIIVISALVVALLIGVYIYLISIFKPEKVALKYFKAYTTNNADALYSVVDLNDSKFANKKLFKESLKSKEKIDVSNYRIEKNEDKYQEKDLLSKNVVIKYIVKGSSKEKTKIIKLSKTKKKKLLFFDNWVVDNSEILATRYTVKAPKNTKVKIDGIALNPKDKTEYYLTDNYVIDSIVIGKHKISFEYKSGIKLEGEMNVSAGSYHSYSARGLNLDSKTKKKIENDTNKLVKLLYSSAIENKDFSEIEESFGEDYRDNIKDVYDKIKSSANSSYSNLKSFNLKDFKINSSSVENDKLKLIATMKYDYTIEYKVDDETKETTKKNQSRDDVYVYYDFKDKDYVMSNIKYLVTYFSYNY